jgi:hypothetical protein
LIGREVEDVLRRRWPEVVLKTLEQEQPVVAMLAGEATNLGPCRRGVEPAADRGHAPALLAGDHLACHQADAVII